MRQALITSIFYFLYKFFFDEGDNPATFIKTAKLFFLVLLANLIFDWVNCE